MLVGCMRVSSESDRQITDLQRDALLAVGVDGRHLFEDHASGAKDDRPGLTQALSFVRPGDVLVVWKLDRLGRSLSHLLCIVNTLKEKQVAFRSLTEGMDTTTASGELLFHVFGALHDGMSKAAVCRNFAVKRTTLIETLARVSGPASG
jgi:DNA invertase Pin-like site-specific DNA recombinase